MNKRQIIIVVCALLFGVNLIYAQVELIRKDFIQFGFANFEHCDMQLLFPGKTKFKKLEEDIKKAKHYIHIEYYKWYNDSIGNHILDLLAKSASKGVNVRLMYDAFGCSGNDPQVTAEFIKKYQSKGINMIGFDPMRFPYINHALHRLHRKMVIIDGKCVYTGGLNVADYYIKGKPELGKWADMHTKLTGPIVAEYQKLFADMWYRETEEVLNHNAYLFRTSPTDKTNEGGYTAFVVDREPGRKSSHIRKSYISCFKHAQKKIRIINPYIILVRSVRKALYDCIKRGVEVEILLGHNGDNLISEVSTAREIYNLSRRGANVWLCKECFHHDKVMIVDDSLCTVGTANLDARSLSFDYEVNVYMLSPKHCKELNSYFEEHRKTSVLLTKDNWTSLYPRNKRRLGWWTKGIRGIL